MRGKKGGRTAGERQASHGNLQGERRPAQGGKVHQPPENWGEEGRGSQCLMEIDFQFLHDGKFCW